VATKYRTIVSDEGKSRTGFAIKFPELGELGGAGAVGKGNLRR